VQFDNHFVGSLPCMPARHDVLCGALDFPWKPWGSIELWEEPITQPLRRAGVTTMLVTDHPHLFENGGENYHTEFRAWEYLRGHEGDPWKTRADPSAIGTPTLPAAKGRGAPYDLSRTWFREELDFPGPRTMSTAANWLRDNAGAHERFMLFIDEFDPHEPFDTPDPWMSKYGDSSKDAAAIWPPYRQNAVAQGILTEHQGRQLRANYGAKLSMIDHWLGKLLDAVEDNDLTQNTLVILCSDHGIYLGERDFWGKPPGTMYDPLVRIPLMIRHPHTASGFCEALTTSVDVHATLSDWFGVKHVHRTHGKSLLPLLRNEKDSVRDWALCGFWGRDVQLITKDWKYSRGPCQTNRPLSMFSNRWSTRPYKGAKKRDACPLPDARATLARMPGSDVPVLHQRWDLGDEVPVMAKGFRPSGNHLFLTDSDPGEQNNLAGTPLEADCAGLLRQVLKDIEAPMSQFARLNLQ